MKKFIQTKEKIFINIDNAEYLYADKDNNHQGWGKFWGIYAAYTKRDIIIKTGYESKEIAIEELKKLIKKSEL